MLHLRRLLNGKRIVWAEALGDYTSLPKLVSKQYDVYAHLNYHVGIAAVDDCLREGFNQQG